MRKSIRTITIAGLAIALMAVSMIASAQNRGGRGNFDPEQFRAARMEAMQQQLEVPADEWKVIEPLITDVLEKQAAARIRGGGFGMMRPGGFGGPGGPGGDRPQRADRPQRGDRGNRFPGFEPDPDVEALQAVLESKDSSADDIKAKLTALRTARSKKEAALKTAREKLRKVLTVRQEAILVLRGMLD